MPYRTLALTTCLVLLLFFSTGSFRAAGAVGSNWLSSGLPLVPLSIAAGLIISCGQIDIASGALLTFAGMIVIGWAHLFGATDSSVLVAVGVETLSSILLYCIMWAIITLGRVPALLCTLGFSFCGQSLSLLINTFVSSPLGPHHPSFTPEHVVGGMTVPVSGAVSIFEWQLLWIALVVLALALWRYSSDAGLQHVAVGMNPKGAEMAGVKIRRVTLVAFLASGALVGLSTAMYLVFQGGGWAPNTGVGKEMFAIAAAVVGGTRIQ